MSFVFTEYIFLRSLDHFSAWEVVAVKYHIQEKHGKEKSIFKSKWKTPWNNQFLNKLGHWGWCPVLWIHGSLFSIYLLILLQAGFLQTSPMLGSHQMLVFLFLWCFLFSVFFFEGRWYSKSGGQLELHRSETDLSKKDIAWKDTASILSILLYLDIHSSQAVRNYS